MQNPTLSKGKFISFLDRMVFRVSHTEIDFLFSEIKAIKNSQREYIVFFEIP